nr:MAG TPA: hypothetical protein [Caudoviricetes sp.]
MAAILCTSLLPSVLAAPGRFCLFNRRGFLGGSSD